MSPTAAMNVAAVCTLTPGTVISRSTSGQASACLAISRSSAAISRVEEVDLAQAPVERQALVDGQLERGQPRAAGLAERVGHRRALAQVARQHPVRLVLGAGPGAHDPLAPVGQPPQRPRPLVGRPHRIQQPATSTACASVRASRRSVLALASVIALSLRVLATTTRMPWRCSIDTILSLPVVASSATTSSGAGSARTAQAPRTRVAIRPADLTRPLSAIATSQKSRCTSNPRPRTTLLSSTIERERGGTHDKDGFVLSAHRERSQGRPRTTSSSQLISQNGLPDPRLPTKAPCPRSAKAPGRAGRQFHLPTTARPTAPPSTPSPAARSASATCAPGPTGPGPTARPNASSAPCSPAGPTAPIYPTQRRTHHRP